VKVLNAVAAGALEQKRQQPMQQASKPAQHHAQAKTACRKEVLKIGLADRVRVLGKKPVQIHGKSLVPEARNRIANMAPIAIF
jgi:hypothetical protein